MKSRSASRTAFLIKEANKRLLKPEERAELLFGLWKGSRNNFKRLVNEAYALAKRHESFGLSFEESDRLHHLLDKLGSSDFGDLYRAVKLYC